MLRSWWTAFLDMLYPPRCPACRRPVAEHGAWCAGCLGAVLAERGLNVAARRMTALSSCRVLCEYAAGVKCLIRAVKYRGRRQDAYYLERLLATKLKPGITDGVDVVVPVPLHPERLAGRGYNQTELIFRRWAEQSGLVWADALARIRPTAPQWELDPASRRRNIKGAFSITRPELVDGKTILLVDDIITTGATLNECARVLKKSGAARVTGLVFASGGDN